MKDLSMEKLQQLVIELAVCGAGSIDFVEDLVNVIEHPDEQPVRPNSQPWCKCGTCAPMENEEHNKCCNRKTCVTSYQMFRKLCLDRDVLQLNITARADLRADDLNFNTNSFRKAAYRQFALWKYGRLGRDNRRILPSCVVTVIRNAYPSPDGIYMGFKSR